LTTANLYRINSQRRYHKGLRGQTLVSHTVLRIFLAISSKMHED
jgi:hypothetical protein